MVTQECDPCKILSQSQQNVRHIGVSSLHGSGALIRFAIVSGIMMIMCPRHLSRPSWFDSTEEGRYDEWRFHLVASLTAIDPRFGEAADDVARRTTPWEGKKASGMLYLVVVVCTKNRPSAPDHGNGKQ